MLKNIFSKNKLGKYLSKLDWNTWYPFIFTIGFIFILFQYSFSTFDAVFYDLWHRLNIIKKSNHEVVLVTLEEESDQFLGDVIPYSYATHLRMLDKLLVDNPAGIVYLLNFSEPSTEVEQNFMQNFADELQKFREKNGFVRLQKEIAPWGAIVPPPALEPLGYSLAMINTDTEDFSRDGVSRKIILSVGGEDALPLWVANAYQARNSEKKIEASMLRGAFYNINADAYFSYFNYLNSSLTSDGNYLKIPFHRVTNGTFPPGTFKDKIVLIGSEYSSNSEDYVLTPFSKVERSPKVNVYAAMVTSLIRGKTISMLPAWVGYLLALVISTWLSLIVSKVNPSRGLSFTIGAIVVNIVFAYLLFNVFSYWLKIAHIILSVFVVYYIWVPFRAIAEYQSRFAIEEEAKLLKRVDKLKQNFISLMSHDLKTPVAKIAGIVDLLKMKFQYTGEQKKLLDNVEVATTELNNFINSILDLTKVESQSLQLNIANKDINQLIEPIVDKLKFEAEQKNIEMETELAPLYPISIDVVLFNRIISNLVENAIKYAGHGKTVKVTSWDDSDWVYVEVKDNGAGMSEEDQKLIFEKFYRIKNDTSHSIRGSGLGLYLVKYFVELLGGTISVESTLGAGTKFLLKFKNA
jgi:signal transduction histidine kinase